jgi:hypothetical protein
MAIGAAAASSAGRTSAGARQGRWGTRPCPRWRAQGAAVAGQAEHVQPACTFMQGTVAALPIAQGRETPRLGAGGVIGGYRWGSDGDGTEEEAQDDDVTRETRRRPPWMTSPEKREKC